VILVSDTGPIIALAKIKQINLLQNLFNEVQIPLMVYKELMAKTGSEGKEIDKALNEFITINEKIAHVKKIKPVVQHLGSGERKAIELAYSLSRDSALLLIDDKAARTAASELELNYTGTVGLLIKAKLAGKISSVESYLKQMRKHGYWLSDEIIEQARKLTRAC